MTIDVPAGWRQGRGAYGGLVVSTLVRAIEERIADPARVVRSVTAEIPGAVQAGAAEVNVDILRAGTGMTTARAALVQDGETRAHAVVIAGARRKAELAWQDLSAPAVPSYESMAALPTANLAEFAQHFELKVVDGIVGTGGAARCVGWVRALVPSALDAGYVAQMIDAWWPAVMPRMPAFRPMATIAFTLQLVREPGDGPLVYRATVPVVSDGFFIEQRELWTASGELVALNHQTFAII